MTQHWCLPLFLRCGLSVGHSGCLDVFGRWNNCLLSPQIWASELVQKAVIAEQTFKNCQVSTHHPGTVQMSSRYSTDMSCSSEVSYCWWQPFVHYAQPHFEEYTSNLISSTASRQTSANSRRNGWSLAHCWYIKEPSSEKNPLSLRLLHSLSYRIKSVWNVEFFPKVASLKELSISVPYEVYMGFLTHKVVLISIQISQFKTSVLKIFGLKTSFRFKKSRRADLRHRWRVQFQSTWATTRQTGKLWNFFGFLIFFGKKSPDGGFAGLQKRCDICSLLFL